VLYTVCAYRACRVRVPPGQRYCDAHAHIVQRHANQAKHQSQQASGRSRRAWQRTRRLVLEHAAYQCELRLAGCTGTATSVHLRGGGYHEADPTRYLAACARCHGRLDGGRRHHRPTTNTRP
jgi:hypothetical protein